jgi:hypothetical protein
MKSKANVLIRISLALLFCLGMFVTANPVPAGQPNPGLTCQSRCQYGYKHQKYVCNLAEVHKRGKDRRECLQKADKDLRECRDKCRDAMRQRKL